MNKIETALRSFIAPQEVQVLPEEVEKIIELVKNPPSSAIEYAQSVVEMFEELENLPSFKPDLIDENAEIASPVEQALETLISGGNVPATIGLLHTENADIVTRFELGVQAFTNHIELLTSDDEVFRDLHQARVAEHQLTVFKQAHSAILNHEHVLNQSSEPQDSFALSEGYPAPAGD